MRTKQNSSEQLEQTCNRWNRRNPVGTKVVVRKDNGDLLTTTTRSGAYVLSGHTPVIMVDGISGCYLLERVEAI